MVYRHPSSLHDTSAERKHRDAFQVDCLRKEIHHVHDSELIAGFYQCMQVTGECCRVAGDINNSLWPYFGKYGCNIAAQSAARWVNDNKVWSRGLLTSRPLSQKIQRSTLHRLIGGGILPQILRRISCCFHSNNLFESPTQSTRKQTCSGIQVPGKLTGKIRNN